MEDAACRGRTKLFFAPHRERPVAREIRERAAHAVCAGCPVKDECREFGQANNEYGIWGGEPEVLVVYAN